MLSTKILLKRLQKQILIKTEFADYALDNSYSFKI